MRFFGRRVERCLIVDVYNAPRRVGADSSKSDYASSILRSVCQLIKARPLPRIWGLGGARLALIQAGTLYAGLMMLGNFFNAGG